MDITPTGHGADQRDASGGRLVLRDVLVTGDVGRHRRARAHPAPSGDVETRWRAIWRHNLDVVGDDPDLIHPGQALRLPHTDTSTEPNHEKDGERR